MDTQMDTCSDLETYLWRTCHPQQNRIQGRVIRMLREREQLEKEAVTGLLFWPHAGVSIRDTIRVESGMQRSLSGCVATSCISASSWGSRANGGPRPTGVVAGFIR